MVTLATEEAFCVLEYARTESIVTMLRRFRTKFGKDPPVRNSIKQWYEKFDRDMLQRVWAEMDYRLDVCRVTEGGHTEHL
jgi:sulfur relay (sulfurtransferase) DsrC/TusE family protein